MGRQPCCDKQTVKRGLWTAEEDKKLVNFILTHGRCCWRAVPRLAGLLRCGKSCRLRWINYLRPDLKRGLLTAAEEQIVIDLHAKLGNRWSKIAAKLPGRTDNEIKNLWNTYIKKKLIKMGIDPATHQLLGDTKAATSQPTAAGDMQSLKETVPIHTTSQSTAVIEPTKSRDTGDVKERSQEKPGCADQNNGVCSHDLNPMMNWPLDVDLPPSDEPWPHYTSSNSGLLGIVTDPLPSDDGALDWLLDYQDLGISSSDLVGNSTVRSSDGSNF